MTIKKYGQTKLSKTTQIEAIENGTRTTITEYGDAGTLTPTPISATSSEGVVTSSVVSNNELQDVKVTVYEDVTSTTTSGSVRISAVTMEEPIETHVDFVSDLAGTGNAPLNGAIFKDNKEDSEFDYFPPKALGGLAGVTSYLVPSVVVEVTKRFKSFEEVGFSQIYDVGRIKSPDVNIPVGSRNWLLIGTQYTQEDGGWTVVNQYQLSGDRNWNANIYQEA